MSAIGAVSSSAAAGERSWEHGVSIVIPCFNEAAAIPSLFERLGPVLSRLCRRGPVEVVFVDDGSTDGTATLLQETTPAEACWETVLLRHDTNRGLGAALRTGLGAVRGGCVVTYDSDCTYEPALILELLEALDRSGASIACGSPYHPEGGVEGVPGWRLALSRGASWLYGRLSRQHLYCYTSMFRAFRKGFARGEWIARPGFVGVTEMLLRAIEEGAEVVEVPVVLRRRRYGQSKMRTAGTIVAHLKLMGRCTGSRLRRRATGDTRMAV